MKIIECIDVNLIKRGNTLLEHISFSINEGDIIGILGPSGAGKSSLFRALNMLHTITGGEIRFNDQNILDYKPEELRKQISYVLQKPTLFGNDVLENLYYPYQILKLKPDMLEIKKYLEKVNLPEDILKRKPAELSGGEQQRIALIRSLLLKPRILLLDEVTSALDDENSRIIENLILEERHSKNLTVMFISHNDAQAKRLAKKILYLKKGKVEFFCTVDEFFEAGDRHE
ncbi:ABC transporter ATP-binding protein [Dendrosporobacter sp. 1207_IL3150]|uniref:ABC transporter ATP-binding protein n=1 Tax=Dendrosporobacter sp. 1207_IL3150 TaxID=3084054 RepID=UPI002FD930C1